MKPLEVLESLRALHPASQVALVLCSSLLVLFLLLNQAVVSTLLHLAQNVPLVICVPVHQTARSTSRSGAQQEAESVATGK